MSSPATYDSMKVKTTALTTAAVQIAAPTGITASVALLRCVGDAAWSYSDASAGTYVSVAANTTVDIPVRDAHAKLWFKATATANLVTASFTSGT